MVSSMSYAKLGGGGLARARSEHDPGKIRVWLFVNKAVTPSEMIGGLIVLAAIVVQVVPRTAQPGAAAFAALVA